MDTKTVTGTHINPSFKAEKVKEEWISPQTKIIYDSKPDTFEKKGKEVSVVSFAIFNTIFDSTVAGLVNYIGCKIDAGKLLKSHGASKNLLKIAADKKIGIEDYIKKIYAEAPQKMEQAMANKEAFAARREQIVRMGKFLNKKIKKSTIKAAGLGAFVGLTLAAIAIIIEANKKNNKK